VFGSARPHIGETLIRLCVSLRGCEFLSSLPPGEGARPVLSLPKEGGRSRRPFTLSPYGLWYAGRSDSEESSDSMSSMSSPPSVPSRERERFTASEGNLPIGRECSGHSACTPMERESVSDSRDEVAYTTQWPTAQPQPVPAAVRYAGS